MSKGWKTVIQKLEMMKIIVLAAMKSWRKSVRGSFPSRSEVLFPQDVVSKRSNDTINAFSKLKKTLMFLYQAMIGARRWILSSLLSLPYRIRCFPGKWCRSSKKLKGSEWVDGKFGPGSSILGGHLQNLKRRSAAVGESITARPFGKYSPLGCKSFQVHSQFAHKSHGS